VYSHHGNYEHDLAILPDKVSLAHDRDGNPFLFPFLNRDYKITWYLLDTFEEALAELNAALVESGE
jgi:hypothetical protein